MSNNKSYRKYAATSMAVAVAASAVAPVVAGAEVTEYTDVSKNSPHYDSIMAMTEAGVLQGINESEFAPYENVHRIQVAKILQRALNLEIPSNKKQVLDEFSDIKDKFDNYSEEDLDAIAAVASSGIFLGTEGDRFNAWTPINREQMASVLVRAFGLDYVQTDNFVDINLSNVDIHHKDNVQVLANLGLTDATSDYRPADPTLREQFASFIDRVFDKVEDAGFAVAEVTGLDDLNKYLQIAFNQPVNNLEPSNIKIVDSKSGERYGVKEVNLASDGLSAQVELFSHEGSAKNVLAYNRDYTVTVNAIGQTDEFIFNRPAFLDDRVVGINVEDREITVNTSNGIRTFTVPTDMEDFDYQGVLGEDVYIWYNGDNHIVDYKVTEENAVYDAVEITKKDEIKLLTADKKHKFSTEQFNGDGDHKVTFSVNGEVVDELVDGKLTDGSKYIDRKYNFAKVGLDKSGNVEFVGVYNLTDFIIVDKVDGDDIIGLEGDGTSGEFDAKDATIIKDNKVISLSDVEAGDILYFNEDANDGDGFAEVYNNAVTGEIENVYESAVRIDGETYDYKIDEQDLRDFDLGYEGAVYQKENGEVDLIDDKEAEKLQAAGEVSVYLDRAGHPVYFSGELADVQSNTKASILIEDFKFDSSFSDAIAQIELVNEDGNEELHQVTLKNLKTISFNGKEYDVKNTPKRDKEVSIKWNADANQAEVHFFDGSTIDLTADQGELINVVYDDSDKVTGLEVFGDSFNSVSSEEGVKAGTKTVEHDDSYIEGYRLLSSTIVFDATDGFKEDAFDLDADDVSVTTWGDYKGSDINNYSFVYNDKNEIVALVIKDTTTSDKVFESTVITNVLRNTDGEIVEVDAYIDGKVTTLEVDKVSDDNLDKGHAAIFEFDKHNSDLVKEIVTQDNKNVDGENKFDARVKTINVAEVKVGTREVITDNGDVYRLVSNGEVIDVSDRNDIDTERLRDLEGEENVTVILDSDSGNFVKYFVIGADAPQGDDGNDSNDGNDGGAIEENAPTSITIEEEVITITFAQAVVADDLTITSDEKTATVASVEGNEKQVTITFAEEDNITVQNDTILVIDSVKYKVVEDDETSDTFTLEKVDESEQS